jgi:HAD domain in Swiss Army Knife RNA repair proteins
MRAKDPVHGTEAPAAAGISPAPGETGQDRAVPSSRPLLMVDIDGVLSLFAGAWEGRAPGEGAFHSIEGIPHFLSARAAAHLLDLQRDFQLVWASGWEEKANDHLPALLGLPADLPFLRFERAVGKANAHCKLEAIDDYAGDRPLAWIDDAMNEACHRWAARRGAPTLLVQTQPELGLTSSEVSTLTDWAASLSRS